MTPPTTPFEEMAGLDKLIHEPARLAIMTALIGVERADFLFLQRITGLTKGNLSTHLAKLEEGALVGIDKEFIGKKPATFVRLTAQGRTAIERHWQQLEALRQTARQWQNGQDGQYDRGDAGTGAANPVTE
jgi:DNA-binding transcriptional ArsR family regulator